MLRALVLLSAGVAAAAYDLTMADEYSFSDYLRDFGKHYATMDEVVMRREIFETRLHEIKHHNTFKTSTYRKGVNAFTDRTDEELRAMLGFKPSEAHHARQRNYASVLGLTELPDHINWVEKGAVTRPKNQGQCGSCYSFSATGALEGAMFMATGQLRNLSQQEFVSCMDNPSKCGGSGGCEGATQDLVFKYAAANGVYLADDYPYASGDGSMPVCAMKNKPAYGGIKGFVDVKDNDLQAHLEAIQLQPVSVSVDATNWHLYHSGVLSFDDCGSTLNHAVLLVGYGTDEETGMDYWLIRNSWGAGWGLDGNIKVSRSDKCAVDTNPADGVGCAGGPSNMTVCGTCGVLFASSYPVGAYLA